MIYKKDNIDMSLVTSDYEEERAYIISQMNTIIFLNYQVMKLMNLISKQCVIIKLYEVPT